MVELDGTYGEVQDNRHPGSPHHDRRRTVDHSRHARLWSTQHLPPCQRRQPSLICVTDFYPSRDTWRRRAPGPGRNRRHSNLPETAKPVTVVAAGTPGSTPTIKGLRRRKAGTQFAYDHRPDDPCKRSYAPGLACPSTYAQTGSGWTIRRHRTSSGGQLFTAPRPRRYICQRLGSPQRTNRGAMRRYDRSRSSRLPRRQAAQQHDTRRAPVRRSRNAR